MNIDGKLTAKTQRVRHSSPMSPLCVIARPSLQCSASHSTSARRMNYMEVREKFGRGSSSCTTSIWTAGVSLTYIRVTTSSPRWFQRSWLICRQAIHQIMSVSSKNLRRSSTSQWVSRSDKPLSDTSGWYILFSKKERRHALYQKNLYATARNSSQPPSPSPHAQSYQG